MNTRTRVVEGMRFVVDDREQRVRRVLGQSDYALKRDVHVWRQGADLANAAEKHAHDILAVVAEYRAAFDEMNAVAGEEIDKLGDKGTQMSDLPHDSPNV